MLYKIYLLASRKASFAIETGYTYRVVKNHNTFVITNNFCKNGIIEIRNKKNSIEITILNNSELITINGFDFNHFSEIDRMKISENTYVTLGDNKEFEFVILKENSEFLLRKTIMQKTLPFVVPVICTYPYFTAVMAILTSYVNEENWLYNNYILLWINKTREFPSYWADFKFSYHIESQQDDYCPLIEKIEINRLDINYNVDYVRSLINDNVYILLNIDMYYIDEWWTEIQERKHFFHQVCIFGYNDEDKSLQIADFFLNKYKIVSIKYKVFEEAYLQYNYYNNLHEEYYGNKIFLLKYKFMNYKLDINHIKDSFYDFIASTNNSIKNYLNGIYFKDKILYGSSCFVYLKKYISDFLLSGDSLNIKIFHLLHLFNKIMMDRFEFLMDNEFIFRNVCILENINELVLQSEILLNCVIKYNNTRSSQIGNHILCRFNSLTIEENKLLIRLYDIL